MRSPSSAIRAVTALSSPSTVAWSGASAISKAKVKVDVDWSAQAFTVRYCGQQPPNKLMDVGFGRFGFFEDHVVSLFVIP